MGRILITSLLNDTFFIILSSVYNAIPRLVLCAYECWTITHPAAANAMDAF